MLLILMPTEEGVKELPANYSVSVQTPTDEHDAEDFADILFRAMIAWGFEPDSVKRAFASCAGVIEVDLSGIVRESNRG